MGGGWFWRKLGRGDPERDVGRELRFHLEMRAREFEEAGMEPDAARAAAERSFGDVPGIAGSLIEERSDWYRRRRSREWWSGLGTDLRRAIRLLRRSPGFSGAIVVTLAVGVALAVSWSAIVSAYLVQPLPFPDADRLVQLSGAGAPDWMEPADVFERTVSWDLDLLSIVGDGRPESVRTSWVTPGWFEASGARPQLGRLFGADEAGPGGAAVAVISHGLWQTRWGADPGVIGRTFTAYSADRPEESEVFTIIGVLEPDFWFVNGFTEVLAPLRAPRATYMATLRPGVDLASAEAAIRRQAESAGRDAGDLRLRYAGDAYVERVRPVLYALGGVVALVLGIALGNALSLVLVRALGRESEFAVKAAIGAGRGRIARQLLAEGLLLAVVSSAAGIALAAVVLSVTRDVLPAMLGTGVPGGTGALSVGADATIVATAVCLLIAVGLALAPLLGVTRSAMAGPLRSGARGTADRRKQRTRSALVAIELALSLALAVGAGLLLRSALYLHERPLGFRPDGVAAISVTLRQSEFTDAAQRADLFDRFESSIESEIPGLEASVVGWAPLTRWWGLPVETPGQPYVDEAAPSAFFTAAGPDYFTTMGMPILSGRAFSTEDRRGTEAVAIVSRSLADRLWPGRNAVGARIRLAPSDNMTAPEEEPQAWRTVVGVVPDVLKTLTDENPPDLYYPLAQAAPMVAEIVLRDAAGLRPRIDAVREAIWRVNPDVPLDNVRWLDESVANATLPNRFLAWLVSAFGGFALALAGVGTWGVVAYAVGQSRRDAAIRMALGATGARVVGAFVTGQAVWIAAGLMTGLLGGWAMSSLLRSQLHGITARDPATWLVATFGVAAVSLLATWLPARAAARAEPGRLLRAD